MGIVLSMSKIAKSTDGLSGECLCGFGLSLSQSLRPWLQLFLLVSRQTSVVLSSVNKLLTLKNSSPEPYPPASSLRSDFGHSALIILAFPDRCSSHSSSVKLLFYSGWRQKSLLVKMQRTNGGFPIPADTSARQVLCLGLRKHGRRGDRRSI